MCHSYVHICVAIYLKVIKQSIHSFCILICSSHVAPAYIVSFNNSSFSANESNGQVVPVLVLNQPPLTDVTIGVLTTDGSATGKNITTLRTY